MFGLLVSAEALPFAPSRCRCGSANIVARCQGCVPAVMLCATCVGKHGEITQIHIVETWDEVGLL